MRKEARVNLSLCAAAMAFALTLAVLVANLGTDGLKGLMMMSIVGLAIAGAGIGAAALVGAAAGAFVYGGTWFVQEAFDLQPPEVGAARPIGKEKSVSTPSQRRGVDLALLRAELELSTGSEINASCPICTQRLSVTRSATSKSVVVSCPCNACRREVLAG